MDFFYSIRNLSKSIFEEKYLLFILMSFRTTGRLFAFLLKYIYKTKIGVLKAFPLESKPKEVSVRKSYLQQELDYQRYQTSLKAYKRFLADIVIRQREQALFIYTSLDVVLEAFKNPIIKVSPKERAEIIHSCVMAIKPLSNGLIAKKENKPIFLKNLLETVSLIFLEKSSRSNIEIGLICPENVSFQGDSLLIELILMTLMGRAIYRTPHDGKVTIVVREQDGEIQLEIRDKGYVLPNEEKLLKDVFTPFIRDEDLQVCCQENGFLIDSSKAEGEVNITTFVIPTTAPVFSSANVTPLFKKAAFLE